MRKRPKEKPDAALYEVKAQALAMIEAQSRAGHIDLFYADETRVSTEGYVPYGWQFAHEKLTIEVKRWGALNVFGLLNRSNQLIYRTTVENINADFVIEQLESLSWKITRPTVVVLDNASAHKARKLAQCIDYWQQRGLFLFYLPPYSPHLNIIERFWKELKEGCIRPEDYQSADTLFYAVDRALAATGKQIKVNFANYQ
ncbi:MAG: IS630 family transposase [Bacteroidota bacterium]